MTTCTDQKQKTAVELFQLKDDPDHRQLTRKLESLLGDYSSGNYTSQEYQHLTLQEFQENFDWEESYSVETLWEVKILCSHYTVLECEDKEECLSYINEDQVMEEPDSDEVDLYHEPEFEVSEQNLIVEVTNLRLKSKEPSKEFEFFESKYDFEKVDIIEELVNHKTFTSQGITLTNDNLEEIGKFYEWKVRPVTRVRCEVYCPSNVTIELESHDFDSGNPDHCEKLAEEDLGEIEIDEIRSVEFIQKVQYFRRKNN